MTWLLSPLETLWCAVALLTAYGVRGVAGFGSGVVATPLMAYVLPLSTIAPLITIVGFVISVRQALREWGLIAWKALLEFVPGILIGVPLGLLAFKTADPELLSRLLGGYVVVYALYSLFGQQLRMRDLRWPRWTVVPIGALGAVVATLFGGMAGPLYVTYFDSMRLAKRVFRVTVSTTLLVLSVVRSVGYFASGVFRPDDLGLIAAAWIPVMFGTWAGEWVHDRISQEAFRRIVGALLIVSGVGLLLR